MKREIEFASHPANLSLVRDFIRQFIKPYPFSESEKDLIVLGLDEACTNVIRYAYHHQPNQLICLVCEEIEVGIRFRLRDYGAQCDPSKLQGRPLDLVQPCLLYTSRVGRRHQPHCMAKCLEFARPVVRRSTGFDADQAWRQLLKEPQNVATLQLTADEHLASSINAVDLEH